MRKPTRQKTQKEKNRKTKNKKQEKKGTMQNKNENGTRHRNAN